MNQDSSFPPMLPPSTELGAILFAILPCLQETYRPLASFAYHITELTRMKTIPSAPPISGLSGIDALITDKDIMLRSLSFYGRMFHMPLLSTIATLLQGMQFYQTYKDILPGLVSGMGGSGADPSSVFGGMSGLSPDLFSLFGGLSPDLLSSLFSGFSGGFTSSSTGSSSAASEPSGNTEESPQPSETSSSENTAEESLSPSDHTTANAPSESASPSDDITANIPSESAPPSDDLYNTLYSFLTPEQQKIYEQLMHTD